MSRQYVALAGLAMVLIVLHHSIDLPVAWLHNNGYDVISEWQRLLLAVLHRLGKPAVPLFFFVSGSFVAYAARGNPPAVSWHTARSSVLRLLWPYVIWSVVFYAFVFVQRGEANSLAGYVKNLLVGYPYHFIPLLVFYYALSPILVVIGRRYGLALILAIGLYQALLIAIEFPGTLGVSMPGWTDILSPPILGVTLAQWAVYFPLGLVIAIDMKRVKPVLRRFLWLLIGVSIVFYVLDVLDTASILDFPAAVHIYPLSVVLMAPLISRKSIPAVKSLESVGKNTYGLYLTHLLVIDVTLVALYRWTPWLIPLPLVSVAIIFVLAMAIPLGAMKLMAGSPARPAYRYVFG